MKIASTAISMFARHTASLLQQSNETLRLWTTSPEQPTTRISDVGKATQSAEAQAIGSSADAVTNDPLLSLIKSIVEILTGKPVRVFDAGQLQAAVSQTNLTGPQPASPSSSAGFAIQYDYHAVREESEQTSFSANGVVKTADGQEIQFQVDLSMARQYREETTLSLRAGDAQTTDPLVLNFSGTAAQLSDQRFTFDLNADGNTEQVPLLTSGSGYLALDKNGNGKVDSGAELFGPATGSGFGELAAYDQDGNGWIDENDPVYSQLRIWSPDSNGGGSLATLKDRNVGALFLGQVATPFQLRGQNNSDLGAIRASGIYLADSGDAGTMQEIDVTV